MSEEKKECPICKAQIEISKFRLHDVACSRQNYLCVSCGLAVLKSERKYHDEEVCGKPQDDPIKESAILADKPIFDNQFEEVSDKDVLSQPQENQPELTEYEKMIFE